MKFLADKVTGPPGHHPAIETLAAYSAGQMRAGFDLVIAAHLRGCTKCRDDVAQFEALGGGLLDTIDPEHLDHGALAATMARLDEAEQVAAPVRSLDELLARARRRWIAPGIWVARVDTPHASGDRVFLLRMGRGAVPYHHHSGAEIVQVLKGSLSDNGVVYHAGDLVEPDDGHAHSPKVAGYEPCICLFAMQGRLRPTNMLGRIVFALAGV